MVAQQKVSEAEYFLNKITVAQDRYDFLPNLSAFMSATRSIPDYLLEDYNSTLGLGIPLTSKLYPKIFKAEAKKQNNPTAISFIAGYNCGLNNLYNDPIAGILFNKRNIVIHRKDVPVQAKFTRTVTDTIHVSDSVSVEVRDKDGNLKSSQSVEPNRTQAHPAQLQSGNTAPTDGVEWFFPDFKNDNVVVICNKFLDIVKNFVNGIKNKYP